MSCQEKHTKYQIDDVDGEVVRKAVVRNSEFKGDVLEDVVKRIRTEFHLEFTKQGNFTICVLISDNAVIPGVAKRCPTDELNSGVGNRVALSKAIKNWLASQ